jgi:hypothetical protein
MSESKARGKRCSTCKQWKPLTEFNKRATARDGHQWSCRDCNKAYHYKNHDRHMKQIRARAKRERAANQLRIVEYLLGHPCVDCGETNPVVLEFDHLRDKLNAVSRLLVLGHPWERILEEIEKCDVVCANCHRIRTCMRADSYRARLLREMQTEQGGA